MKPIRVKDKQGKIFTAIRWDGSDEMIEEIQKLLHPSIRLSKFEWSLRLNDDWPLHRLDWIAMEDDGQPYEITDNTDFWNEHIEIDDEAD